MNQGSTDWLDTATYHVKMFVAKTALLAMGAAFEIVSKLDPEVQREVADWADGEVFSMGILPHGPYISLVKEGSGVRYLGTGMKDPNVAILFKNLDAALLVFTGQIGTHTAAAEKRFIVIGDLAETMKISRTMGLVQAYLFPGFIVKKTFKRVPQFTRENYLIKAKVYAKLVPVLAAKLGKKAA
ncbi:MAG: hypothetical protein P9L99_18385 [Candidatus Lernaella stagnicola]|nr:hypothetical protein [Candidatus Lernaella stagnicola]